MDKDCPICNGVSIDDLIDTPGMFDLCLKHLEQWLCTGEDFGDLKPGLEPKKAGIKLSEPQETPIKTKI